VIDLDARVHDDLQAGSPAIGAGLILSSLLDDFDGLLRPVSVAPDIGAYRYQ